MIIILTCLLKNIHILNLTTFTHLDIIIKNTDINTVTTKNNSSDFYRLNLG